MDERLNAFGGALLGLAALAMSSVELRAQGLVDPTRPPNALAAENAAPGAVAATQLQSVLISPGRRIAVINGTSVPLGGKFGDATLVRIAEGEVELRNGGEKQVLTLLPGIDKKPVRRVVQSGERRK